METESDKLAVEFTRKWQNYCNIEFGNTEQIAFILEQLFLWDELAKCDQAVEEGSALIDWIGDRY